MRWNILYRGPLSSCNYGCNYCPFAKTKNSRAELQDDARKLQRFVDWVAQQDAEIGILFTPWGEAMIRRHYQRAFVELSRMEHVAKVAIQTNLTFPTQWIAECNRERIAFWTTFHPTQTTLPKFLRKCAELDALAVRYSVGVVGFGDALPLARELRAKLPDHVYLWANAYKRDPNYYSDDDITAWEEIDPLFRFNTRYHPARGRPCEAGFSSFTVDGEGDVRRCHFIKDVLGNIYQHDIVTRLSRQNCVNDTCGCHIGYVHMPELGLYEVFGDGLLERIPSTMAQAMQS
ncbi:MAG: STM4011 family radical SAM protein [bacterium]